MLLFFLFLSMRTTHALQHIRMFDFSRPYLGTYLLYVTTFGLFWPCSVSLPSWAGLLGTIFFQLNKEKENGLFYFSKTLPRKQILLRASVLEPHIFPHNLFLMNLELFYIISGGGRDTHCFYWLFNSWCGYFTCTVVVDQPPPPQPQYQGDERRNTHGIQIQLFCTLCFLI